MLSGFYRHYSRHLLIAVAATFPILFHEANTIPNNNEIETWLPDQSQVRDVYQRFKADFGDEEIILVGVSREVEASGLSEAISERLERLPGIRACWSPREMSREMERLGVSPEEARARMRGLCLSRDEELVALTAILSDAGVADRAAVVADMKRELAYCQLAERDYLLAGHPVVITEMDRLGNIEESRKFFMLTLAVSALLLYRALRNWNLSLAILGLTLWGIQLSMAMVKWCGGEANFILSALSVMVMVFTLSVAIHVIHYYRQSSGHDRMGTALRLAWMPCFLSVLTTAVGLASLVVSEMGPVRQFGWSSAIGSVVSLIVGFGLVPAVLTLIPLNDAHIAGREQWLAKLAFGIVGRSRRVVAGTVALLIVFGWGISAITARIEPLDFLPQDGKVHTDVLEMEARLASVSSIEAVVDFGGTDLAFGDKLARVRALTGQIASHPRIEYALSVATFFPEHLPSDPFELMSVLNDAKSRNGQSDFVADGERLWRISARLDGLSEQSDHDIAEELAALTAGDVPVYFTGMEVLLEHTQQQIFNGFWESFSTAFLIITVIMVVALRSLKLGIVGMLPNLTPIALVFGCMGWMNSPVDIGTMMTGSIALGLAVDGTFHYLIRYNEALGCGDCSSRAARKALLLTGGAISNASIITALGMLALVVSSFGPTSHFGVVMCGLMLAAVVGDLVLLPALLGLRREDRERRRRLYRISDLADTELLSPPAGEIAPPRRKAS